MSSSSNPRSIRWGRSPGCCHRAGYLLPCPVLLLNFACRKAAAPAAQPPCVHLLPCSASTTPWPRSRMTRASQSGWVSSQGLGAGTALLVQQLCAASIACSAGLPASASVSRHAANSRAVWWGAPTSSVPPACPICLPAHAPARWPAPPALPLLPGTPISAYGTESQNRAARQRIPHRCVLLTPAAAAAAAPACPCCLALASC